MMSWVKCWWAWCFPPAPSKPVKVSGNVLRRLQAMQARFHGQPVPPPVIYPYEPEALELEELARWVRRQPSGKLPNKSVEKLGELAKRLRRKMS